jgi:hypothetical protein
MISLLTKKMALRFPLEYYDIELKNGEAIIIPKNNISSVTIEQMLNTDYSHSEIVNCSVNYENVKCKYRSVLVKIWELYGLDNVLKHTTLSIIQQKSDLHNERGYRWNDKLQISFRGENANRTMREILNICNLGEIIIDIRIRLKNGTVIHYISN